MRQFFFLAEKSGLGDLGNSAGTHSAATLTDSETQALLNGDGGNQLHAHLDVIAGHAHLSALGQGDDAGHVGGAEVELRTIVVEEGGVTAALVLGQDVNLALELGVGMNGTGLRQNLAALDAVAVQGQPVAGDILCAGADGFQDTLVYPEQD